MVCCERRYPSLIGLSGKAGSGKDTFAKFLEPFGYIRISFADPLKTVAKLIFGLTEGQVTDPRAKEEEDLRWGMSPRRIMQEVGKKMREIHSDVWLRQALARINDERINNDRHNFVITDVRFPNEADVIRSLGGVLVRIERAGVASPTGASDDTETALDKYKFDLYICNNGSLEDLRMQAGYLVTDLESMVILDGERRGYEC